MKYKIYYKRNLPHFQPPGDTFFVTYRLNDSLPAEVILRLKAEREKYLKRIAGFDNKEIRVEKYRAGQTLYFEKFDALLDKAEFGPVWLKDEKAAQIVKDALHFYDKKKYDLICYTILPNHVHQVFTPILNPRNVVSGYKIVGRISDSTGEEVNEVTPSNKVSQYIVTKILQDLKKYTAVKCNKILNRSGAFWQHEIYDHVVRNTDELQRIIRYVINNPVKSRFCDNPEEWKWTYCNFDLII